MITRIVRMTFRPEAVDQFLSLFDESSGLIRAFDGCHHLELWRAVNHPNVFTTYSIWRDASALDEYRESELFQSTWRLARPLFAAPPEADSHIRIRSISMKDSA